MIEGILDTILPRLKDDTVGVNAKIKTHNDTATFFLGPVRTIDVWDRNQSPSAMVLPALLVEWQISPRLELTGQGKWRGEHTVRLWYWIDAKVVEKNRRHIAGMASVIRSWVDTLPNQGTIQEVLPIRMQPLGWRTKADLLFSGLMTTLQLVERDELAIP